MNWSGTERVGNAPACSCAYPDTSTAPGTSSSNMSNGDAPRPEYGTTASTLDRKPGPTSAPVRPCNASSSGSVRSPTRERSVPSTSSLTRALAATRDSPAPGVTRSRATPSITSAPSIPSGRDVSIVLVRRAERGTRGGVVEAGRCGPLITFPVTGETTTWTRGKAVECTAAVRQPFLVTSSAGPTPARRVGCSTPCSDRARSPTARGAGARLP